MKFILNKTLLNNIKTDSKKLFFSGFFVFLTVLTSCSMQETMASDRYLSPFHTVEIKNSKVTVTLVRSIGYAYTKDDSVQVEQRGAQVIVSGEGKITLFYKEDRANPVYKGSASFPRDGGIRRQY